MDEIRYAKMCPRFDSCSVNKCPLDVRQSVRTDHPKDSRRVCQLHLRERMQVVAHAKSEGVEILGGGLTRDEITSGLGIPTLLAEWDARKERERAQMATVNARRRGSPSVS